MRKADYEVREVLCSETGKPMPKIPLWMADIKVKFISDEARQRHPSLPAPVDFDSPRRSTGAVADLDDLKSIDTVGAALDEPDAEFEDLDAEAEEAEEEEFEA